MDVDGRSRRTLQTAAAVALACGVGAFVYIVLNSVPCYFDDAYMFIRYANNLLAGYGHAWNPGGEQTFGSTSLTHLGVVTLLKACFGGLAVTYAPHGATLEEIAAIHPQTEWTLVARYPFWFDGRWADLCVLYNPNPQPYPLPRFVDG